MMERKPTTSFFAHTRDGEEKRNWQSLLDHLEGTSKLAESFGHGTIVKDLAKVAGLLHDLGKFSVEFQERLEGKKIRVDHSSAGAKEIKRLFDKTNQQPLADLIAFCILGHHTGLPNYGDASDLAGDSTFIGRLKSTICDYQSFAQELNLSEVRLPAKLQIHPNNGNIGFTFAFLTRMIYSALVDADFQDTERFIQGEKNRGNYDSVQVLRQKLDNFLEQYSHPSSEINRKRTDTLKHCIAQAERLPGFFKLTVPTGGGKTLASISFALNHAVKHNLDRIIYVIPYTSIIEQNAGVFKRIFGEENVLEHHSNFDWQKTENETVDQADDRTKNVYSKLKLAAENWDIPIVVTTNVQFFESLFANKSSRCRKLHNLINSVIVFDEAQMFPKEYMIPSINAVWELVTNYGASTVFCTATQPNLERFFPRGTKVHDLAPDPDDLFRFYKRVNVIHLKEKLSDDDLTARLNGEEQVVCIVNTRKHASGLFDKLLPGSSFHLSTLMCPCHREQKLKEIRRLLENNEPCRVVSTSVIEAGIDVDFKVGYRALTGLDSINQAAGRVNRNMKQDVGIMYIFEPDSALAAKIPRFLMQGADATRNILRRYPDAVISQNAIHDYFELLYSLKSPLDFDYKRICEKFTIGGRDRPVFQFQDAAHDFRIIEDATRPLIIPFNKGAKKIIDELKYTKFPLSTVRKLQPYTVSIYENEFDALSSMGIVETISDSYAVLSQLDGYYNSDKGLVLPENGGGIGLFF